MSGSRPKVSTQGLEATKIVLESWGIKYVLVDGEATLSFEDLANMVWALIEQHSSSHGVEEALMDAFPAMRLIDTVREACAQHHERWPISDEAMAALNKHAERAHTNAHAAEFWRRLRKASSGESN